MYNDTNPTAGQEPTLETVLNSINDSKSRIIAAQKMTEEQLIRLGFQLPNPPSPLAPAQGVSNEPGRERTAMERFLQIQGQMITAALDAEHNAEVLVKQY